MPGPSNGPSGMIRITVVVLVTVVMALALALAGCGGETTSDGTPDADGAGGESATTMEAPMTSTSVDAGALLIGKWVDVEGNVFEFLADGKFASDDTEGINMTYVVEGDEIMFKSDFGEGMTIKYSLDGDTLLIEDPETGELETATRVN